MTGGSSRRPVRRRSGRPGRPRAARLRAGRIRLLTGLAVLALVLLGMRAAFLGTVRAGELSRQRVNQSTVTTILPAQRGAILARDGTDLADDRLAVDVTATPYLVTDRTTTAAKLAPILGVPESQISAALAAGGGYAVLARDVAPAVADRARALRLPGIDFTDTWQRYLPAGREAAQVIGLVDQTSNTGLTGIELQANTPLQGTNGKRVEIHDLFDRPIQVLQDQPARPGGTVELTIDPTIQARVESTAAATRKQFGARTVNVIVMDPRNGAIYAMATAPGFNPNDRAKVDFARQRNRSVTDIFEPGSTFKIVTMSGALQDGVITPSTRLTLPVGYTVLKGTKYQFTLHDSHREQRVRYSATQILQKSSNIGTVMIGERLGSQRLYDWIKRFGFGATTGIDYPGESAGDLPARKDWSGTSIVNIPIGQGVGVTLTQLARAYAVIANGGRLVQPHLIGRIDGRPVPHPVGSRILSARTAREVNRMLQTVVTSAGTGDAAKVAGFKVAGKTGTSNQIDPKTHKYSTSLYWSSFVGYAPAQDPQVLVAVMADRPTHGSIYGGDVAAPAFEQIMQLSLQKLGIAP